MPVICVEIELDTDTQQFKVELCEPKDEMAEGAMPGMTEAPADNGAAPEKPQMTTTLDGQAPSDESGEQTFASVEEALQAAKALLLGDQAQSPEEAKMSMAKGYAKAGNLGMRG